MSAVSAAPAVLSVPLTTAQHIAVHSGRQRVAVARPDLGFRCTSHCVCFSVLSCSMSLILLVSSNLQSQNNVYIWITGHPTHPLQLCLPVAPPTGLCLCVIHTCHIVFIPSCS